MVAPKNGRLISIIQEIATTLIKFDNCSIYQTNFKLKEGLSMYFIIISKLFNYEIFNRIDCRERPSNCGRPLAKPLQRRNNYY